MFIVIEENKERFSANFAFLFSERYKFNLNAKKINAINGEGPMND